MLVHCRVTRCSKFAGIFLYIWVERGTIKVKCLAQEHNAVPRPGLEAGPFDPESSALTIRAQRLPLSSTIAVNNYYYYYYYYYYYFIYFFLLKVVL